MCGRFALSAKTTDIEKLVPGLYPEYEPAVSYNIAPGRQIAAITPKDGPVLEPLRWGLVPVWAKSPMIGNQMINARSESVDSKPAFRGLFKNRRCLIPATGFYEWKKLKGNRKQPWYFSMKGGEAFTFAGLWDSWGTGNNQILSCTIITTTPNDILTPVHHRMPVIVPPDMRGFWLNAKPEDLNKLKEIFKPYDSYMMQGWEVSDMVNHPSNNSPDLIEPVSTLF